MSLLMDLSMYTAAISAVLLQDPFLPYLLGINLAEALAIIALLRTTTR